jgi:midasin (ATPase involved in ribosome maturation)
LGVLGEIVDEFSLDRKFHRVLDARNGTNTLQDLSRLSLKIATGSGHIKPNAMKSIGTNWNSEH